jgi:putative addiction module component (TIGR02574 family)
MEITLDKLTVPEKLRLMEALWADLSRHEADLELPAWHADVLHETGRRVAAGKETPIDWESAKKELRARFA